MKLAESQTYYQTQLTPKSLAKLSLKTNSAVRTRITYYSKLPTGKNICGLGLILSKITNNLRLQFTKKKLKIRRNNEYVISDFYWLLRSDICDICYCYYCGVNNHLNGSRGCVGRKFSWATKRQLTIVGELLTHSVSRSREDPKNPNPYHIVEFQWHPESLKIIKIKFQALKD